MLNHFLNMKLSYISFPLNNKLMTILRSPHKYKKSREQFIYSFYKFKIYDSNFFSFFSNNFLYSYMYFFVRNMKLVEKSILNNNFY
jgi:hypothetical protein